MHRSQRNRGTEKRVTVVILYISHFPQEKFPRCDADRAMAPAIMRRLAFHYERNIYAESNAGRGEARKHE